MICFCSNAVSVNAHIITYIDGSIITCYYQNSFHYYKKRLLLKAMIGNNGPMITHY